MMMELSGGEQVSEVNLREYGAEGKGEGSGSKG